MRVLVLYHSQSGDVRRALETLVASMKAPGVEVCWRKIQSAPPFPFPWSPHAFFDCMPEAVAGRPPEAAPAGIDPEERFDLVVLGWQVWFLSPSLPVQAFFRTREAEVLRGTRVISVTCCRQMWQRAHGRTRRLIAAAGGLLSDSVVLTHQGGSLAGYLTAPRLMLTGRREQAALLPAAGVAAEDIAAVARFGRRLAECTERWDEPEPAPLLADLDPCPVPTGALLPELAVIPLMVAFSRLARACGGPGSPVRRPVIWLFVLLLVLTLPVLLAVSAIVTPLLRDGLVGRLTRILRGPHPAPDTSVPQGAK